MLKFIKHFVNSHFMIAVLAVSSLSVFGKIDKGSEVVSMNVYAIHANDNTKGMTQSLFNHAVQTFKDQGHVVDVLSLYDRAEEIPFFAHSRKQMESFPFYLENRDRFLKSDVLLIVFPVYWYSTPGILKAWIDMIGAWAYQYESGAYAKPLHHIKQAIIICSCFQSMPKEAAKYVSAIENQMVETCKFIGISDVRFHVVDHVYDLSKSQVDQHFGFVKKMCQV